MPNMQVQDGNNGAAQMVVAPQGGQLPAGMTWVVPQGQIQQTGDNSWNAGGGDAQGASHGGTQLAAGYWGGTQHGSMGASGHHHTSTRKRRRAASMRRWSKWHS